MTQRDARGFNRDQPYRLTVDQVLALRSQQNRYRAIADNPNLKESARQSARREIARIEAEIRA